MVNIKVATMVGKDKVRTKLFLLMLHYLYDIKQCMAVKTVVGKIICLHAVIAYQLPRRLHILMMPFQDFLPLFRVTGI